MTFTGGANWLYTPALEETPSNRLRFEAEACVQDSIAMMRKAQAQL